jgi:Icc-related predicted phosphoesterase
MRLLVLADDESWLPLPALMASHEPDVVVTLGDLEPDLLDPLGRYPVPVLGVYGNHDDGHYLDAANTTNLHMARVAVGGITFAGFEGCVRYSRSGTHQYTQKEGAKLARKLPAADVLLCHCPPLGINDDADDAAHIGWSALLDWVDEHRPRHVLHGHTHPMPGRIVTRYGDTQIHYVSGARLITLG